MTSLIAEFPNFSGFSDSGGRGWFCANGQQARVHIQLHLYNIHTTPAARTNGLHVFACCSHKWDVHAHACHFCGRVPNSSQPNSGPSPGVGDPCLTVPDLDATRSDWPLSVTTLSTYNSSRRWQVRGIERNKRVIGSNQSPAWLTLGNWLRIPLVHAKSWTSTLMLLVYNPWSHGKS